MARGDRREQIFEYVRTYIGAHGYGPTVREICGAVGLKSTASVHFHLRRLAENGLLSFDGNRNRTISLAGGAATPGESDSRETEGERPGKRAQQPLDSDPDPAEPTEEPEPGNRIPVIGTVAAGQPILAMEQIEGYVPWEGGEGWFALRVKGLSMKNAGILPGDLVIVRPQPTAEQGEIVVALIDDEATVKRLDLQSGRAWLLPENEAFDPIDGSEAVILGLVRGVVRRYG